MADNKLALELDEFLNTVSHLDEVKDVAKYKEQLENAMESGKSVSVFRDMRKYNASIADAVVVSAAAVVINERFYDLKDKGMADVIRKGIGPGVVAGFDKTAKTTSSVYERFLRASGKSMTVPVGKINIERFKAAIAGAINSAIENDGRLENIIKGAFRQNIREGERESLRSISEKVEQKYKQKILARRFTTSSDPCDYCISNAGIWYESVVEDPFAFKFHDRCKCGIETQLVSVKDFKNEMYGQEFYLDTDINVRADSDLNDNEMSF